MAHIPLARSRLRNISLDDFVDGGPRSARSVIESLLGIVQGDPALHGEVSSFWREGTRETLVERRGDEIRLQGVDFGGVNEHWAKRPLRALERLSYARVTSRLRSYPRVWRTARRLARDLAFDLTYDIWKYSVVLSVLADHWAIHGLTPRTFAMIGDGFGFLGALIRRCLPGALLCSIDLPKMLVFQAHTHAMADRSALMSVLLAPGEESEVTFVPPPSVELVTRDIDCAVNMDSMQEMTPASIAAYFTFLRRRSTRSSRFYCINRAEKVLPDGEVVRFADYPWLPDDEVLVNGECPFHRYFLDLYPFRYSRGPRLGSVRIPFVNYFDGTTMHRLVRLAPPRGD